VIAPKLPCVIRNRSVLAALPDAESPHPYFEDRLRGCLSFLFVLPVDCAHILNKHAVTGHMT